MYDKNIIDQDVKKSRKKMLKTRYSKHLENLKKMTRVSSRRYRVLAAGVVLLCWWFHIRTFTARTLQPESAETYTRRKQWPQPRHGKPCRFERGVDYGRSSRENRTGVKSEQECCAFCANEPSCAVATYMVVQEQCWFKGQDALSRHPSAKEGAVSCVLNASTTEPVLAHASPVLQQELPSSPKPSYGTSTAPHPHIRGQSSKMPLWMREYFLFHTQQRESANEPKYLVLSCNQRNHQACGGTADRLKPIPYYLLLANRSRRVLLIWWTKPCPLENWLQPLDGGIDWRAPASVQHAVDSAKSEDNSHITGSRGTNSLLRGDLDSKQIVTIKLQVTDGCMEIYSEMVGAAALDFSEFNNLYGEMFRSMFTPVPTIAHNVQKTMKRLKLESGKYVSAHLRARHPNTAKRHVSKSVDKQGGFKLEGSFRKRIHDLATNAVNCAGYVSPTGPIYFASDSHDAVRYIVNESSFAQAGVSGILVSGNIQEEEPLHLDTPDFKKHKCDAFNDVFEDLLILGSSKCVVVGCGGYGRFGQLLSWNSSCRARHQHYNGAPEFNGKKDALCPSLL